MKYTTLGQVDPPGNIELNQDSILRPSANDTFSPLWKSMVFRTIPEWNRLPATVAEAESLEIFKNRLTAHKP